MAVISALVLGALAFLKGIKLVVTSAKFMKLAGIVTAIKGTHATIDGLTQRYQKVLAGDSTKKQKKSAAQDIEKAVKLEDGQLAKLVNEVRKALAARAVKRGIEFDPEELFDA